MKSGAVEALLYCYCQRYVFLVFYEAIRLTIYVQLQTTLMPHHLSILNSRKIHSIDNGGFSQVSDLRRLYGTLPSDRRMRFGAITLASSGIIDLFTSHFPILF